MCEAEVPQVVVCDTARQQLTACVTRLTGMEGAEKPFALLLDVNGQAATLRLIAGFDVAIGALSNLAGGPAMQSALRGGIPLVDLACPDHNSCQG